MRKARLSQEEIEIPIFESGEFSRTVVVSVNDDYYSPRDQKSHTVGHEITHYLLRAHPNPAIRSPENTPEGHLGAGGGILQYGKVSFRFPGQVRSSESDRTTQVTTTGLAPLSQANVTEILRSVPQRPANNGTQPAQNQVLQRPHRRRIQLEEVFDEIELI